jgi:DNA-binding CsgD family transcriptional regulator
VSLAVQSIDAAQHERAPFEALIAAFRLEDGTALDLLRRFERCGWPPCAGIIVAADDLQFETFVALWDRNALGLYEPVSDTTLCTLAFVLCERRSRALVRLEKSYKLSERQAVVLELAIAGATDKDAADVLGCTRGAIAKHWERIFDKTGARSQRDVLALVVRSLGVPTRRGAFVHRAAHQDG